ncbi:MAG: hypothetical protein ACTHLN_03070 [Tepidisphaeraceae bacterium]
MRAKELLQELTDNTAAETTLEHQAARIPPNFFWIGALGSIGLSLGFKIMGRDRDAEFVGHWAPTFIGLGILRRLMDHDHRRSS